MTRYGCGRHEPCHVLSCDAGCLLSPGHRMWVCCTGSGLVRIVAATSGAHQYGAACPFSSAAVPVCRSRQTEHYPTPWLQVAALRFNTSGTLLASGGLDGELLLLQPLQMWAIHPDYFAGRHPGMPPPCAGRVGVWEANSGRCMHVLEGPNDAIGWLDWHPRGDLILAGSEDFTIWLWNARTGACMAVRNPFSLYLHTGSHCCLSWREILSCNLCTGRPLHAVVGRPY